MVRGSVRTWALAGRTRGSETGAGSGGEHAPATAQEHGTRHGIRHGIRCGTRHASATAQEDGARHRSGGYCQRHRLVLAAVAALCACGCAAPGPQRSSSSAPVRLPLQSAEPPRRVGILANAGLQIPVVSPDGQQVLYLQLDAAPPSPMTLFGSLDPQDTPPEGSLYVCIRTTEGSLPGKRLSRQRWAHSPVWSDSGRSVAYVVNEPPGSRIVHVDLETGQQTDMGLPGGVNCLPRFDGDDRTLLFTAGPSPSGPLRVYRRSVGESSPAALSPEGSDCLFPMTTRQGQALCAQVRGQQMQWVWTGPAEAAAVGSPWGHGERPAALASWAGVACPVAPDGQAVLFYDCGSDRLCTLHPGEPAMRRHRAGGIAGCWLDSRTIALATQEGVFITDACTGASTAVLNGQWIPCRYIPQSRKLILLGRHAEGYFAIWEVVEKPPGQEMPAGKERAP